MLQQAVHEVYGIRDSYIHMSSDWDPYIHCPAWLNKRHAMPKQVVPTNTSPETPQSPQTPWKALAFSSCSTTFGSGLFFSTFGRWSSSNTLKTCNSTPCYNYGIMRRVSSMLSSKKVSTNTYLAMMRSASRRVVYLNYCNKGLFSIVLWHFHMQSPSPNHFVDSRAL